MSAQDPYIGVRIADGGYKLVAKIGEGGMGAVYRAVQEESGTEVAVKILHMKYALEREFVERFKREVKVMRSLRHPNTVRIISDGEMEDSSLYIVMELLQGRGLDVALKHDGPWPLDRAIAMVLRVAYALEEAHRLNIVHRDMKPENIFLVQRPGSVEIPKLLDFGLAKVSRAGDSGGMSLTQEGDILGTPAFMSPEQSFGESLDGRADIYSLAVILYELLTGHLPFEENATGPQIAHFLNDPIPINERVEGLSFPTELWQVLSRALQKLPEDRYSTAMEFAESLKPFNTHTLSVVPPAARTKAGGNASNVAQNSAPQTGSNKVATPVPPPRTPLPPAHGSVPPPGPTSHSPGRGGVRSSSTLTAAQRPTSPVKAPPPPPSRTPLILGIIAAVLVLVAVIVVVLFR